MSKTLITQTNGATAEDISAAIGAFLEQQGKKEPEEAKEAKEDE
jgi:hypothetical protein